MKNANEQGLIIAIRFIKALFVLFSIWFLAPFIYTTLMAGNYLLAVVVSILVVALHIMVFPLLDKIIRAEYIKNFKNE